MVDHSGVETDVKELGERLLVALGPEWHAARSLASSSSYSVIVKSVYLTLDNEVEFTYACRMCKGHPAALGAESRPGPSFDPARPRCCGNKHIQHDCKIPATSLIQTKCSTIDASGIAPELCL